MSGDDKPLWIEIVSRRDEVLARHKLRCGAEGVRIGRGYDNDVMLDDPYVAPHHLRIVRDAAGGLVAEDLGSAGGTFVGEDRRRVTQATLDGEQSLRIGRTTLRVRETDHAVAPERVPQPRARIWPVVLVLAGVLLGLEDLSTWLRDSGEPKLGDYLAPLLAICLVVGVWTAGWAILSRIFAGRARFGPHLLIAVSGLLVFSLANEASSYGAFAISSTALVGYRYIGAWLLAAVVCFLHLRLLSQSREAGAARLRLKAAAVATLALVGIGMQTLSQWEASASSDRQLFLHNLKPPALRLVAQQTDREFFAGAAGLKGLLDRERTEPAGEKGNYAGSEED